MADTVRYLMEQMVPELEDMQKKRYFSRQEVKEIVRKRQDFEYKLKRKAALKEDFLSYAEFETKLDQLRQARRRGLGLSNAKQTLADYSIVKRVHFIFERAVRKFKRDLSIWTRWLEFCRATRSNRRLSRVAARALQLHPNAPGLWTYAAAWEFEENGNPGAARALMQQGLRMCKDSRQMWLHYLDMELMYVEKLRARRKALALDVPEDEGPWVRSAAAGGRAQQQAGQQQEEQQQHAAEDGEGPMDQDGGGGGGGGGSGSILTGLQDGKEQGERQQEGGDDADAAVAAVLTGAVAGVVIRGAAAALPRDLALRRGMLEAVRRYAFPGTGALAAAVVAGVERDFPEDPEAADLLARYDCDPADAAAPPEAAAAAAARFEATIAAAAAGAAAGGEEEEEEEDGDEDEEEARGRRAMNAGATAAAKQRRRDARARRERVAALWRLYCAYLQERLGAAMAAAGGEEARVQAAAAAAQQLLRALQRAHEAGAAGEEVYERWSEVALQLKQKKMALKAAKLACAAFPSSPDVWRRRVALEARLRGSGAAAAGQLLAVVREAVSCVPADKAPDMWLQALDVCTEPGDLDELASILVSTRAGAARGPASGGMGRAAARVLQAVWASRGAEAGRKLFWALAALPPAGGDVYRAMLQLEGRDLEEQEEQQAQQHEAAQQQRQAGGRAGGKAAKAAAEAKAARGAAVARVRRVLEAAVGAYGEEDASLWLAYARFEQQHTKQGAGPVYWRAVKALRDPDAFVHEYRSSVCAE